MYNSTLRVLGWLVVLIDDILRILHGHYGGQYLVRGRVGVWHEAIKDLGLRDGQYVYWYKNRAGEWCIASEEQAEADIFWEEDDD